jgi:hypothetical protein
VSVGEQGGAYLPQLFVKVGICGCREGTFVMFSPPSEVELFIDELIVVDNVS